MVVLIFVFVLCICKLTIRVLPLAAAFWVDIYIIDYEETILQTMCRCSNTSSDARSWSTRCWRRRLAIRTGLQARLPLLSRRRPLCRPQVAPIIGTMSGSTIWKLLYVDLMRRNGSELLCDILCYDLKTYLFRASQSVLDSLLVMIWILHLKPIYMLNTVKLMLLELSSHTHNHFK